MPQSNENLTWIQFQSSGEDRLLQQDAWKDLKSEIQSQATNTINRLSHEWLNLRKHLEGVPPGKRSEVICLRFGTYPSVSLICQEFDEGVKVISHSKANHGWQITGFVKKDTFPHGWALIIFKVDENHSTGTSMMTNTACLNYMFNLDSNPGPSVCSGGMAEPKQPSVPSLSLTAPSSADLANMDDLRGIGAQTPTQGHYLPDWNDPTISQSIATAYGPVDDNIRPLYSNDWPFEPANLLLPPSGTPSVISNFSQGASITRLGIGSAGFMNSLHGTPSHGTLSVSSRGNRSDGCLSGIANLFLEEPPSNE